ncbi:MAG: FAD-dependent oxidoreductase [Burkholderiaceae bacterium]
MRQLLLLGGGHAHVEVLRRLARSPWRDVRVSLVSTRTPVLYSGMVPGIIAGHYPRDAATIDLRALVRRAGAEWLEARVTGIDAAARQVRLADRRSLGYDLLSLDVGSVTDTESIPGAGQYALPVRPIEAFARAVEGLYERATRRYLAVVVVGGGAAAVELALALQHRLEGQARITLVAGDEPPLSGFPTQVRARAARALHRRSVAVVVDRCVELNGRQVRLAQGTGLACDVAVLVTGANAQPWLLQSALALDPQGYVATGADLRSLSHPNVYAVGDTATQADSAHPRSGVYAVRAGPALATNLRRSLDGAAPLAHRPSARSLNLLACGDRYAIASWGDWSAEGRWVWWWKDHIDRRWIARYR